MQKVQDKMIQAYLKARAEMLALENEEDGLETVETVILVAVAVIIAGLLVNILTKNFGGNDQGLIGYFFKKIQETFDGLFGG